MSALEVLKKAWVAVDTLMVIVIFSLVTLLVYGSHFSKKNSEQNVIVEPASEQAYPDKPERSKVERSSKGVSVAPVVYERGNATQIARNMVRSELTALPARRSLDMRESDNKYLVSFSLPKEVVEKDLQVVVAGNILTLIVESGDKTYMQRVRIPCDFAGESSLNHYVSNQLLVVEISK